jgi:hypothetical protein
MINESYFLTKLSVFFLVVKLKKVNKDGKEKLHKKINLCFLVIGNVRGNW